MRAPSARLKVVVASASELATRSSAAATLAMSSARGFDASMPTTIGPAS